MNDSNLEKEKLKALKPVELNKKYNQLHAVAFNEIKEDKYPAKGITGDDKMDKIVKILHLEDDERDAMLVHEIINSEITFSRIRRTDNQTDFESALKKEKFDIIISDFSLPTFDGMEALKIARNLAPDTPFIYVSGHIGEERAIFALKNGATDYVLKDKPAKFVPAILRALNEVTEKEKRKIAEEALRESEHFISSTLNSLTMPIAVLDDNGKILKTNKAWEIDSYKNSSVPQGIKAGGNYLECCRLANAGSPNAIKFATGIMSVINGYKKDYIQEYQASSSGRKKWFLGRVNRFEGDGPVRIVVVHIDITEAKIASEKLRESEKRHRLIAENSTDVISTSNIDGTFIYVSPASENLLGYKPEEITGKKFFDFLHPEDLNAVKEAFSSGSESRNVYNLTYRIRKNDGSYTWFESTAKKLINNETGGADLIISVSRDISERKMAELELMKAKEKAEDLSKVKSNFLANMSHELRTPLIGILGFSEILKSEIKEKEYQQMVDTIYNSGNRLLDTLNLILDLSRIEANRLQADYKIFNAVGNINEIVNLFKGVAGKKGLFLKVETELKSLQINSDERMFREIIENLVNNAVKFTLSGGVTVKINKEDEGENQFIIIKVIDTGIGIPEASQQIVFEEFRQASEGNTRAFEGTGLGLTITKKFVERLGGSIKLESTPGEGTAFTVKLPVF